MIVPPTQSPLKFQQASGRGLRTAPWINKKDCIILSFGDKDHKICTVAMLLPDAELRPFRERSREFIGSIPIELNPRLKTAIASYDPLGKSFSWRHEDGVYILKCGKISLQVAPAKGNKWQVLFTDNNATHEVATNIDFELAFGIAEDFAREHKDLFIIHDLNAAWRKLEASDKQKDIFRKHNFKKGIDKLTRGQASILISSGILSKSSK